MIFSRLFLRAVVELTNKEAEAVHCAVINHDGHLRTRGKCKKHELQVILVLSTFLECSQMYGVLILHTRLRLLHLLYDIDFTRAKQ